MGVEENVAMTVLRDLEVVSVGEPCGNPSHDSHRDKELCSGSAFAGTIILHNMTSIA